MPTTPASTSTPIDPALAARQSFVTASKGQTKSLYVFPSSLRAASASGSFYPFIAFAIKNKDKSPGPIINLPLPPGIQIGDNMNYSDIDLGQIGDVINKGIQAGVDKKGSRYLQAGAGVHGMAAATISKASTLSAGAAAAIAAKALSAVSDQSRNVLSYSTKMVLNPNTSVSFQSAGIRGTSFSFKLAARTKQDSDAIKAIVATFRQYMYPDGDNSGLILEFPGTWYISFQNGDGENQYIPGLYESYLASFSSTYNGSSNMLFKDGAPIEVDITAQFREVRALRRTDIVTLSH
jgi:hypothetical protein